LVINGEISTATIEKKTRFQQQQPSLCTIYLVPENFTKTNGVTLQNMRVPLTMPPSSHFVTLQHQSVLPVVASRAPCLQKPDLSMGFKQATPFQFKSSAFFSPIQYPSTSIIEVNGYPSQDKAIGTGVYFNDCEVHQDMHPVQVRYSNRYTTVVSSLPKGKPMPQAPTLALTNPKDGRLASCEPPSERRSGEEGKRKRSPEKEATRDNPKTKIKRSSAREDTRRTPPVTEIVFSFAETATTLTSDQKTFLEAALALTEMGSSPCLLRPTVQLALTLSPRSVVPPPRLCMPSAPFDLRVASPTQNKA
jgi:hypothetical protein